MQSGLIETLNRDSQTHNAPLPQPTTAQHGSGHHSSSPSDAVCAQFSGVASGSLDVGQLGETHDRLSVDAAESAPAATTRPVTVAGQRIAEYENAVVASPPRHSGGPALAFKVVSSSRSGGVQLTDFPNEILTQILSHLHPDSHGAVALISKRFYALVTTPYAWRAAFLRYFPGQDSASAQHAIKADKDKGKADTGNQQLAARNADSLSSDDVIRSEVRYFTRLTPLASWRSEYLLRTRLLRSVVRGKPGSNGSSSAARSSQSGGGKKAAAVLTYNSKLPWMISHVHADFAGGKKGPRVIHGTRDLGVATVSDPTTGRIEKWGLDDPFSFQQLDEVFPNLDFYGVGEGPAAAPNVMDVSQPFGLVGGEGFPGGRVYYKAAGQLRGHYLGREPDAVNTPPEIPKIPGLVDAVSCVWIAKSSAMTSTTQSMAGIVAGSTLGVVTCYALGHDSTGPRYADGDMTARWVLCPGVPIVDIKVDDQYSLRRKALGRVWAVALNALGEVYYLTEVPSPSLHRGKAEDIVKDAWNAGRTAYWELIESTRRVASPDEFDKNAVSGTYSPRSSANAMGLGREQIVAEAREIEQFFWHTPSHFRKACQGWDMLRKLEVDFAAGDEHGSGGEAVFVVGCGNEEGERPSVRRFVKGFSPTGKSGPSGALTPVVQQLFEPRKSIFGEPGVDETSQPNSLLVDAAVTGGPSSVSGLSTPRLGFDPEMKVDTGEWRCSEFVFKHGATTEITASAVDMSTYAVMAAFEDPLVSASQAPGTHSPATPTAKHTTGEIPGRRARLLAVGTNTGAIVVWNMRDAASTTTTTTTSSSSSSSPTVHHPMRIIQTESPEVTCLALSALYLVAGGSDALVQAWDPLASSLEPVRTLNAKSSGRIPRHILHANPALQHANYFAVRAVALDPDPAVLRGVLAFGTFVRFWGYSSTSSSAPGRKRGRLGRHADLAHGRPASRRGGGAVASYIAAEEAELRREQAHRSRELERLRKRFGDVGVGALGGGGALSEEEAMQYARMISEEAFLRDEVARRERRESEEETVSTEGTTSSSGGSGSVPETVTPEPSLSGGGGWDPPEGSSHGAAAGPSGSGVATAGLAAADEEREAGTGAEEEDYEEQIQRAIRLSLLEGVGGSSSNNSHSDGNGEGQSPCGAGSVSSGDLEFHLKVREDKGRRKGKGKGKGRAVSHSLALSPVAGEDVVDMAQFGAGDVDVGVDAENDLALALRLSLEEEEARVRRERELEAAAAAAAVAAGHGDEYPPLETRGKGKEKWF